MLTTLADTGPIWIEIGRAIPYIALLAFVIYYFYRKEKRKRRY